MMQIAYVVVPFQRIGTRVGATQAMIVDGVGKARQLRHVEIDYCLP